MKALEIRIVLWCFATTLAALGALGFAGRAETTPPPRLTIASPQQDGPSPLPGDLPAGPAIAAPSAKPVPESLSGLTSGPQCPLGRVAMVRGSDSEASEGGGFNAARANAIHGAVDLDGFLGEPVFSVADGKVVVAAQNDRGKLGKTVVVDHLDGGHTVYGHLDTVDVKLNSTVTAGQILGTMGYSGNAKRLQAKNLPPHLHFAYVRGLAPFTAMRDSVDDLGASFVRNNAMRG